MREESRPTMINEFVKEILQLEEAVAEARVMSRSSHIRAVADMVSTKLKNLNYEAVDYYDRFLQLKHRWQEELRSRGYL